MDILLKSPTFTHAFAPAEPSAEPYVLATPGTRTRPHPLKGVARTRRCVCHPTVAEDAFNGCAGLRLVEEEDGLIDERDPWYLLCAAAVDLAVRQVTESKRR